MGRQKFLDQGRYTIVVGCARQLDLTVEGHQRIGQVLRLYSRQQVGVTDLLLPIGQVNVAYMDTWPVALLQIVLGNARGLRRRPGGPSAAGLTALV